MKQHRLATPTVLRLPSPQEGCRNDVMSVAKNVCPDLEGLARDSFHRISPRIDHRIDVLDEDTAIPAAGKGSSHVSTISKGGGNAPRCKHGAAIGNRDKTASLINRS